MIKGKQTALHSLLTCIRKADQYLDSDYRMVTAT